MTKEAYAVAAGAALAWFEKAGIVLTREEKEHLEVADFGLGDVLTTGLEIVVYVNTEVCCAKELALLPGQTCPEHIHTPLENGYPGKEETFRCRYGTVYLYVPGEPSALPCAAPPAGDEKYYTVFHEVILTPGLQYTLAPGTKHWFQAGPQGAVVSEFSTKNYDECDIFTDPRIRRIPVIE